MAAKLTIYCPDDLAEQIRENDMNASAVAQSAWRNELLRLSAASAVGEEKVRAGAARLRATRTELDEQRRVEGLAAGRRWALETATAGELEHIAEMHELFTTENVIEPVVRADDEPMETLANELNFIDDRHPALLDWEKVWDRAFVEGALDAFDAMEAID